jgi:RimJ/RimL family protein N-acetyltransferase
VLAPRSHNQGFATEAVRAALAWFEGRFGSMRTVCLIDPGNAPSLRVAAKCGFTERLRTTHKGQPTVVLER